MNRFSKRLSYKILKKEINREKREFARKNI